MISIGAKKTLPFLALVAVLAGCSGQTGTTGTVDPNANASAQSVGAPAQGQAEEARFAMHRHGGPHSLLFEALREPSLNLSAEQKTAIENAIKTSMPQPNADQGRAHAQALAAQIRAGKIDTTTLGPSADEISARDAAEAKALDTLHATLNADQRKALVATIEARFDHERNHEGREQAHVRGENEDRREHLRGERGEGGPMHGLLGDLELTQAQKDQVKAKMEASKPSEADREAMKAKMQATREVMKTRLESFATDTFDAKAFVAAKPEMKGRGNRMADELSALTSVLDSSQREKLAQRIEQGPEMRREHRGGPQGVQGVEEKPGTKL